MATTKIFFILLALIPAYAHAGQSETITISATVPPMRFIVVDRAFKIQEITSNSPIAVQPTIKLISIEGPSMQWNTDIEQQYNKLLPTLDFSHPGIVYSHTKKQSAFISAVSQIRDLIRYFI